MKAEFFVVKVIFLFNKHVFFVKTECGCIIRGQAFHHYFVIRYGNAFTSGMHCKLCKPNIRACHTDMSGYQRAQRTAASCVGTVIEVLIWHFRIVKHRFNHRGRECVRHVRLARVRFNDDTATQFRGVYRIGFFRMIGVYRMRIIHGK